MEQPKICAYKGLNLGKIEAKKVTEEEVMNQLDDLLKRNPIQHDKEGESELHDVVTIDFEGFVDGVAFEGGKGENYDLELGSNTFIPGFEDQLLHHKKGENVDVKVAFPENYHAENLKGKEAIFKCAIKNVKQVIMPEANDDFAKTLNFETLDQLKEAIKEQLNSKKTNEAYDQYIAKILDYLVANSEIEVEETAKNQKLEELLNYMREMIQNYGMSLEDYLAHSGLTLDQYKERLIPQAEKEKKTDIICDYIIKEENITVTEEEFKLELDKIKAYYQLTEEQYARMMEQDLSEFKKEVLRKKVLTFILENNN